MMPLAERMKARAEQFEMQEKQVEYKIYRTLFEQIWSLLPGYCSYPTDVLEVRHASASPIRRHAGH
jgi:ribosomal RNA-processing protein 12